jgi:hypothetical protein
MMTLLDATRPPYPGGVRSKGAVADNPCPYTARRLPPFTNHGPAATLPADAPHRGHLCHAKRDAAHTASTCLGPKRLASPLPDWQLRENNGDAQPWGALHPLRRR